MLLHRTIACPPCGCDQILPEFNPLQFPDKDRLARCRRPLGTRASGLHAGGTSALPRHQTVAVLQPRNRWKNPLHSAPCNALRRFLKRGLGIRLASAAFSAGWELELGAGGKFRRPILDNGALVVGAVSALQARAGRRIGTPEREAPSASRRSPRLAIPGRPGPPRNPSPEKDCKIAQGFVLPGRVCYGAIPSWQLRRWDS